MAETAYERALSFAAKKHEGQFRIGGDPYITHPIAVAEILAGWGWDEPHRIAGLFHDLLEDTDAAEGEILALGGEAVLACVKRLTKTPGYVMAEYVAAIKADPMARRVKAADRLHNLRCALVAGEDFKRKYILETVDWYLDLCPEIPDAVRSLAASLAHPLPELSLEYRPVESWLETKKK